LCIALLLGCYHPYDNWQKTIERQCHGILATAVKNVAAHHQQAQEGREEEWLGGARGTWFLHGLISL
jgi:hypothetical protein